MFPVKKNSQLANALNSNVLSEQMSRIEAKVDDLQTVMKLIQQAMISNNVVRDFESTHNLLGILPVKTVESLDQSNSETMQWE